MIRYSFSQTKVILVGEKLTNLDSEKKQQALSMAQSNTCCLDAPDQLFRSGHACTIYKCLMQWRSFEVERTQAIEASRLSRPGILNETANTLTNAATQCSLATCQETFYLSEHAEIRPYYLFFNYIMN
ncbi:hypothetical protein MTR67_029580 [Solanum verrucosum]|uniref:Uncharacterized protein n=1 Tax=Solanum verrucosum TaxID=315347 RepID=A0AAF0RBC8_SOLVR|nr:hypothetical protein MTR67_029580 [Solanum verrucosum]